MMANEREQETLRDIIRKELGSDMNRRFLARIGSFRPEDHLPDELASLLDELDRAERKNKSH